MITTTPNETDELADIAMWYCEQEISYEGDK